MEWYIDEKATLLLIYKMEGFFVLAGFDHFSTIPNNKMQYLRKQTKSREYWL
jgi:hypothetical protein|tara:strand:+ start:112568 stop:112723 length:156 start_codon:yes stop_codon:yes gene_type:complete